MRFHAALFALSLALALPARADDDCDGVMAQLVAAQRDVAVSIDAVDALEAAITAPEFDPVVNGWMLSALDQAVDDLIADLNTAAIAEARAHEAHCY